MNKHALHTSILARARARGQAGGQRAECGKGGACTHVARSQARTHAARTHARMNVTRRTHACTPARVRCRARRGWRAHGGALVYREFAVAIGGRKRPHSEPLMTGLGSLRSAQPYRLLTAALYKAGSMQPTTVCSSPLPTRGPNRPVVKKGKIVFSLSRLFFFGITDMLGVDSFFFLIFTTRVGLKTRLNGVKSICFEQSRKF